MRPLSQKYVSKHISEEEEAKGTMEQMSRGHPRMFNGNIFGC